MIKNLVIFCLFLSLVMPNLATAKTKIVIWHAYRGTERTAFEQVAKNFNSKSTTIEVELLAIPYDAFADKVTASIPRGKGPDLFVFAQDRIGDWAQAGLIEALDFWGDQTFQSTFLPETIKSVTYDDQLYAVPLAFKMVALFYNKKLIPTPPKTTDELIQMGKKVTNAQTGVYGLVYENANFYHHAAWLHGFGGSVFSGNKPALNSQAAVDAAKFAQDLALKDKIMPEEISSTLVTSLFNKGSAAMVINGPWFIGEISGKISYGVTTLPTVSASGKPAKPFLTAEGMLMSSKSANKKDGWEVIKYFTSLEAAKVMAKQGRQTPALKSVYSDASISGDPVLKAFKTQLANTVPMANTPAMRMIWGPATKAMNKIINGKQPPKQPLDEAQKEAEQLVKGARR